MQIIAATEIKQRLGQYLETALTEPVIIKKSGRPSIIMLSIAEYERLQAIEDALWAERAEQALQSGFVGGEEAMNRIQERLNATSQSNE